jgi:hypothetical protein
MAPRAVSSCPKAFCMVIESRAQYHLFCLSRARGWRTWLFKGSLVSCLCTSHPGNSPAAQRTLRCFIPMVTTLGRLVLVAVLAFLVLNLSPHQEAHGAAEEAPDDDGEVAVVVQVVPPESTGTPASMEVTMEKRILPPSGPSQNSNYVIDDHQHGDNNMSSSTAHAVEG